MPGCCGCAWGLVVLGGSAASCLRIIPAHAGMIRTWPPTPPGRRRKPRVCGVYGLVYVYQHCEGGSSPRVRGLHRDPYRQCPRRRIIPACAGFTSQGDFTGLVFGDHPRVRGVYREGSCGNCRH